MVGSDDGALGIEDDARLRPCERLFLDVRMQQLTLGDHDSVHEHLPPIGVSLPADVVTLDGDGHRHRACVSTVDFDVDHVGAQPVGVVGLRPVAAGREKHDCEHTDGRQGAYRSSMTEFTVHLPNRPGSLADLAERLGEYGINIEALAAIGIDETGTVRLIVDDEVATRRLLDHHGIRFEERRVITTILPNRPGSVASMTRQLADSGINIDAMYLLRTTAEGLEFAIAFDDAETNKLAS